MAHSTIPNETQEEKRKYANLELIHLCDESFEEHARLEVTSDEARGVTLDDRGEDQVFLAVSDSLEQARDRDELLHLSEVLRFDLLQRRPELESLLSVDNSSNSQLGWK